MGETLSGQPAGRPRQPRRRGRPRPLLGAARQAADRRAVGNAPAPEARAGDLRPAPAPQPVRPPRRGARRSSTRSRRRSIRTSSRSASPAASRRTSGPACCSATSTGSHGSLWNEKRPGPGRLRRQGPPRRSARPAGHPGDLRALDVRSSSAVGSSSSRTTTSGSPAISSPASTSGSTTRAGRSRRPGRAA